MIFPKSHLQYNKISGNTEGIVGNLDQNLRTLSKIWNRMLQNLKYLLYDLLLILFELSPIHNSRNSWNSFVLIKQFLCQHTQIFKVLITLTSLLACMHACMHVIWRRRREVHVLSILTLVTLGFYWTLIVWSVRVYVQLPWTSSRFGILLPSQVLFENVNLSNKIFWTKNYDLKS